MPLERVSREGEALIYRGDPRLEREEMDSWWNEILTEVGKAKVRPYLYASDAGLCVRKNVYLEWNTWVAEEKRPDTRAYMAIGVALENLLAEGLKSKGALIAQGLRIQEMPELKISGIIDLVIIDSEKELALVEVKSCGELPSVPNPIHLAQIQTYSAVSGIDKCWLTYISRNVRAKGTFGPGVSIRTFRVGTSKEELVNRLRIAALSVLCSRVKKIPPVDPAFRKDTECHFCVFKDFCWTTRPSLGSVPPNSPLEELSISEYIVLNEEAGGLASRLVDQRDVRKEVTIDGLMKLKLDKRVKTFLRSQR